MDGKRDALAVAMNDRRLELRIRWVEVARRAQMDAANLRRIRRGEIAVTDDAAYGIEVALGWAHGTVLAILAGGGPTPIQTEQPPLTEDQQELMSVYRFYERKYGPDEALRRLRRDVDWINEQRARRNPAAG